ncbi:hypothetical protein LOD99_12768 [Oopsacas minuta]|uniref:Uncharacterized protein n=1 Tax=Oopsacas minuta TaxID=111878 RepID=A0AAV7JD15_9METZ|nr:hypothetical protein LOD99_12768 [Oopsacas minuta]
MSSDIDHLEMDPSNFYFANDPRHPQNQRNIPLQPLLKQRQMSQGAPMQGNIVRAPLSPSRSLDLSITQHSDQVPPEKQYHFLPGDEPEFGKPSLLPKSMSRDGVIQPPYPGPQPHPRNFSPMDRNNIVAPNPQTLLPFANNPKQGFTRDPLENRAQQTFSTFLEDKHYETLEKRGLVQKDTASSSIVNFPPSNPTMTDVKNMKVDDDDTIVRHITVTKKQKKYPIHCLLFLCQLLTIVLILAVAAVAVIALLEAKNLEATPTTQAQSDYNALKSMIENLTNTISVLETRIITVNEQLTQTNTTLDERVEVVEDEGVQLNSQFQSLNNSLKNESLGPCIHNRRNCRANTGNACLPNGNNSLLKVMEGYRVTGVWCEGSLDNETLSLDILSTMSTYVVYFEDRPQPAYECGCRAEHETSTIYNCITNIVQCKV